MKSAAGDSVVLQLPGGTEYLTVLEVCYERISVRIGDNPPTTSIHALLVSPLHACSASISQHWPTFH
jgi:hypothetical protein